MVSIIHILLIIVLMLQLIMLVYTLVCQIQRNKEDKNFWKEMDKSIKVQVNKYNELYPGESMKLPEEKDIEQDK